MMLSNVQKVNENKKKNIYPKNIENCLKIIIVIKFFRRKELLGKVNNQSSNEEISSLLIGL